MSKTYNDPAKQLTRMKFKEFIEKQFPDRLIRRKLRVACFPGAEAEGEEALEVKEVYDPLGIPRENIIGLERDAVCAQRLRAANLGIEVVEQDAYDFFKGTDKACDIIGLDYKGQRTWRERDTTRYIAGKGLLGTRGIFCSVHIAQRESEQMQTNLALIHHGEAVAKHLNVWYLGARSFFTGKAETLPSLPELDLPDAPLDEMRKSGITYDTLWCFHNGSFELHPENSIFANVAAAREYGNQLIGAAGLANKGMVKTMRKTMGLAQEAGLDGDPMYRIARMIENYGGSSLARDIGKAGLKPEYARTLLHALSMIANKGYCTDAVKTYEYTSNKRQVMQMNLFAFRQFPDDLAQRVHRTIEMYADRGIVNLKTGGAPFEKFLMRARILCKDLQPFLQQEYLVGVKENLGSARNLEEKIV